MISEHFIDSKWAQRHLNFVITIQFGLILNPISKAGFLYEFFKRNKHDPINSYSRTISLMSNAEIWNRCYFIHCLPIFRWHIIFQVYNIRSELPTIYIIFKFDTEHPTKQFRSAVRSNLTPWILNLSDFP